MRKLTKKKRSTAHFPRKPVKINNRRERTQRAVKNKKTGEWDLVGIPKDKFLKLIYNCGGLVKYIAAACGVTRKTIYDWKNKYPWVAEAMKDCDEDTVDLAVHNVVKNIRKGKEYSTTWYLDRKGKNRGLSPPKQYIHHDTSDYEDMDDKSLDKSIQEELERINLCQNQQKLT